MNYSFMAHFLPQIFGSIRKFPYICTRKQEIIGAIAQLVEQRTENPCVPGSIPGGTTERELTRVLVFVYSNRLNFSAIIALNASFIVHRF